jgi:hypothetical protein
MKYDRVHEIFFNHISFDCVRVPAIIRIFVFQPTVVYVELPDRTSKVSKNGMKASKRNRQEAIGKNASARMHRQELISKKVSARTHRQEGIDQKAIATGESLTIAS